MLRIAFCDDKQEDRDKIMYALSHIEEKWKDDFEIASFSSGEELCNNLKLNNFHIILLDILMEGIDGIETDFRVRSMGKNNLIIFISNYDERVKELFDFQTIAFLDKPLDTNKLEIALKKAYDIIESDDEHIFAYKKSGNIQYVPMKEIIYLESRRNSIIIKTTQDEELFYDTLANTWLKLQDTGRFIMPHKSFIFNLNYVTLKANLVMLKTTSQTYNIGSKYRVDTVNRYMHYIEKRCI